MPPVPTTERDPQRCRAAALNLQGLLAHWAEVATASWVADLLCRATIRVRIPGNQGENSRQSR
jgi:hypothetical protein